MWDKVKTVFLKEFLLSHKRIFLMLLWKMHSMLYKIRIYDIQINFQLLLSCPYWPRFRIFLKFCCYLVKINNNFWQFLTSSKQRENRLEIRRSDGRPPELYKSKKTKYGNFTVHGIFRIPHWGPRSISINEAPSKKAIWLWKEGNVVLFHSHRMTRSLVWNVLNSSVSMRTAVSKHCK